MAFKVGDKAKVVDKESFLYNKTVELVKIDNEVYIFYCESEKLNFVVHKETIQRTIKWESSPDKAETNSTVLEPYNPVDKWIIRLKRQVALNELIEISDEDAFELIGILWNYKRLECESNGRE